MSLRKPGTGRNTPRVAATRKCAKPSTTPTGEISMDQQTGRSFHSSGLKHASDQALKKREVIREAVSTGRFTVQPKPEGFQKNGPHAKEEKGKEGAR
jgi:hypothetical protein